MIEISNKIKAWLPPETIEPSALQQLQNMSELPFIHPHIAVMPDCHLGKGACVGSVIATTDSIIPAAVGVDIGCGMMAIKTKFFAKDIPDNLGYLRNKIERAIPLGAGRFNEKFTNSALSFISDLCDNTPSSVNIQSIDPKWANQLGTLGSGNHFIEMSLDENDQVWLVLHSGSRGIGNKLASRHIKIAQALCDMWHIPLKDKDLSYLPSGTIEFSDYIKDLHWAQTFARLNREEMMNRVIQEFAAWVYGEYTHEKEVAIEGINCHHNFTQLEQHFGKNLWITRKGAIQMRESQFGVIPGSMGTRSYIVSGKQNVLSFHSAPHGAGRRFSRTEARKRFSMADYDAQMKDIECRRSSELIDELPGAYKDIDDVMENSRDLVDVVHVLKQILNVKGD